MKKIYYSIKARLMLAVKTKSGVQYAKFAGGFITDSQTISGSYTTSDEEMQKGIEETILFKNKEIFIQDEKVEEQRQEDISDKSGFTDYPEVKNQQLAEETLRGLGHTISPGTKTAMEVALFARSYKISFSNWPIYKNLE